MIVSLASVGWGPQFIVPSISIRQYDGCVVLRETLDDKLFRKELRALDIDGRPIGYSNTWYIRKKGLQSWIKIGESYNKPADFAVHLDTTAYENGCYQVLGFMSVKVKTAIDEVVVSRQNIAELNIRN